MAKVTLFLILLVLSNLVAAQSTRQFSILDTEIRESETSRICPVLIIEGQEVIGMDTIRVPNDRRVLHTLNLEGSVAYIYRSTYYSDYNYNQDTQTTADIHAPLFIGLSWKGRSIQYLISNQTFAGSANFIVGFTYFDPRSAAPLLVCGYTLNGTFGASDPLSEAGLFIFDLGALQVERRVFRSRIMVELGRWDSIVITHLPHADGLNHWILIFSQIEESLIKIKCSSTFDTLSTEMDRYPMPYLLSIGIMGTINWHHQNRFVYSTIWGEVGVFSFDRCSGTSKLLSYDTLYLRFDGPRRIRFCYSHRIYFDGQLTSDGNNLLISSADSVFLFPIEKQDSVWRISYETRRILFGNDTTPRLRFDPTYLGFTSMLAVGDRTLIGRSYGYCPDRRFSGGDYPYLSVVEHGTAQRPARFIDRGLYLNGYRAYHVTPISPLDPGPLVTAYAGWRDTLAICPSDSVRLGRWADERNLIYEWQPTEGLSDASSPRPWASPARTTTYTLTVRPRPDVGADCITRESHRDTVTVAVRPGPLPFSLGPDRAICPDAWPVVLSGPSGDFRYRWSTGDTTADLSVAAPGRYRLTVSDSSGRCPRSDSVEVGAAPLPDRPDWQAQYEICPPAETLVLPVDSLPGHAYRWADGPTVARRRIARAGTYRLTIRNPFGCTDSVGTQVVAFPRAAVRAEPEAGRFWCPRSDGPIRLVAEPRGHRYRWSTGETTRTIQVDSGGLYRVRVLFSESCTDSAQIRLDSACEDALYIPTAFSPNGDGTNDTWQVLGGPFAEFDCRIFDRWGRLIFQTNDAARVWSGSDTPEGIYTVLVRWRYRHSGEAGQWKGTVSVVR